MNNSIIRVQKTENYTIIHNELLHNPNISAKAKGIFAYIMTLPNDWVIHLSELTNHFSDGRDSISSGFNELIENGYAIKEKINNEDGSLGWFIQVFEVSKSTEEIEEIRKSLHPVNKPSVGNTTSGNTTSEKPNKENTTSENPTLLNTNNILNTKFNNQKNHTRYSAFEYDLCIEEAVKNQNEFAKKDSKVLLDKYSIQTWRRILKPLYDEYGVEGTLQGIKNSVNFNWLVTTAHYSFSALFSNRIFPRCVKKAFENPYQTKGDAVSNTVVTEEDYKKSSEDWR